MKSRLLPLAALFALCSASLAHASSLTYVFTVSSDHWTTIGTPAFGLSANETMTGYVVVDNAFTGFDAFKDFSFTTGTHTWTLAEFVGPTAKAYFDESGYLQQFDLNGFVHGNTSMYFYSNNTTNVYGGNNWFFCNGCVSIEAGTIVPIPGPGTLGLVGLGIVCIGYALRRRRIMLREVEIDQDK